MAAGSVGLPRPTVENFRRCVQNICPISNVPSLRESQFQALYSFICGEEVFVNLPTGYFPASPRRERPLLAGKLDMESH